MTTKMFKLISNNLGLLAFAIVALLSAIFEISLYTFLFEIIEIDPVSASPISQICSMVFNFTLNKFFTFKAGRSNALSQFSRFFILWLFNLLITTVWMYVFVNYTEIYPTISRFAIMIIIFFFNYFISKKLIFKKPDAQIN